MHNAKCIVVQFMASKISKVTPICGKDVRGLLQGVVVPSGCTVCHAQGCDFHFFLLRGFVNCSFIPSYNVHIYCIRKSIWVSLEKRLKSKRVSNMFLVIGIFGDSLIVCHPLSQITLYDFI